MAELTALWAPPDHECRDEFAFRLITANSTRCLLHTPPPQFRMRPNHVGGFWLPSLAAAHTPSSAAARARVGVSRGSTSGCGYVARAGGGCRQRWREAPARARLLRPSVRSRCCIAPI